MSAHLQTTVTDILRQQPVRCIPDKIHRLPDDDGKAPTAFMRWYAKNREAELKRMREYAAANGDKIRAKKREHYQKNRKKLIAKVQRYYKNTPQYREKRLAAARARHAANREEINAKARARYAAKKAKEREHDKDQMAIAAHPGDGRADAGILAGAAVVYDR